jgi:hypothetical protein
MNTSDYSTKRAREKMMLDTEMDRAFFSAQFYEIFNTIEERGIYTIDVSIVASAIKADREKEETATYLSRL